jgi:hypothetical protein
VHGRLLGDRGRLADAQPQELAGQLVLVGEVPVGGGDVDARVPRDVVERGVEPAGGEDLRGGVDDPLAVTRSFIARRGSGHMYAQLRTLNPDEHGLAECTGNHGGPRLLIAKLPLHDASASWQPVSA